MVRFTLTLALWLFASTAHAQLTRDAVGNGRSALESQLTVGEYLERPSPDRLCSATMPCDVLFPRDVPFVTLQFRLAQHVTQLAPDLALEFDLDAALVAERFYTSRGDWQGFWAGSPWLGLSLASRARAQTLRISLGIAPPVAGTRHASLDFSVSPGGTGAWNEWLTLREAVAVGLLGLGEWRHDHFDVGADAALVIAPGADAVSGWAAAGVWLTGHLSDEVDLGARLQGVVRFTHTDSPFALESDSTAGHAALTPFVRYSLPPVSPRGEFSRAPSPSPVPAFIELKTTFGFLAPDGPVFLSERYTASLALAAGTNW